MTTPHRPQRTIRKAVEASGVGFFTGADVTIRFLPAAANHGIAFQRVDCSDSQPIPACIEFAVPRHRRTAIKRNGVAVEMIEHMMAALAGLQIDNCLVQLNAAETPGFDGSCREVVERLLDAGLVEQNEPSRLVTIGNHLRAVSEDGTSEITVEPMRRSGLTIDYHLDYGTQSPIQQQHLSLEISPDTFLEELAFARTFVLESEVSALKAQGYGSRTTAKDLLVFGEHGIVENELRSSDECVRHKILDCIGDFALLGCDICGHFTAHRSGHQLNREIIQKVELTHSSNCAHVSRNAA